VLFLPVFKSLSDSDYLAFLLDFSIELDFLVDLGTLDEGNPSVVLSVIFYKDFFEFLGDLEDLLLEFLLLFFKLSIS
jgi:hypothetical protein